MVYTYIKPDYLHNDGQLFQNVKLFNYEFDFWKNNYFLPMYIQ